MQYTTLGVQRSTIDCIPRYILPYSQGVCDRLGEASEREGEGGTLLGLEETGWKLVHGDVFRPPSYPTLLSPHCLPRIWHSDILYDPSYHRYCMLT